jgi:hypothetical protein
MQNRAPAPKTLYIATVHTRNSPNQRKRGPADYQPGREMVYNLGNANKGNGAEPSRKRFSSAPSNNMTNSTASPRTGAMSAAATGLTSGNSVVDAIDRMSFEGNIIDHRWLNRPEFRLKSGLIYLPAIIVLADLVYWHRPTHIRDEQTNLVIAVRKKFQYDTLYKDYGEWGASIGLTKRQTQDAVTFLVKMKLVKRRLGSIPLPGGGRSNTLPFLELVPEKLAEITYGMPLESIPQREAPHVVTRGTQRRNVRRQPPQREALQQRTPQSSQQTVGADAPATVADALEAHGVDSTTALRLASANPDECTRQIAALPTRKNVKNAAAYLVRAIEKRYSTPIEEKTDTEFEHEFEALKPAEKKKLANELHAIAPHLKANNVTGADLDERLKIFFREKIRTS